MSSVPVVIISFERYTYLRNMIEQLVFRLDVTRSDIIIVDNASAYPPLQRYLTSLEEQGHSVIRMPTNQGHLVAFQRKLWESWPRFFALTDPDLEFHADMPRWFRDDMVRVIEGYNVPKVGCALDISDAHLFMKQTNYGWPGASIPDWERQFWSDRVNDTEPPIYRAFLDTTFAVYDKERYKHSDPDRFTAMRIAGQFTAKHLPWYDTEKPEVLRSISCVPTVEERDLYDRSSRCSSMSQGR